MLKNNSILGKYIFKQLLVSLLIVSVVLLSIAWSSQAVSLLKYMINDNISFWNFLRLSSFLIPDLLVEIFPISVFTIILFVYSKMIVDKELIVMSGSGLSSTDLVMPAKKLVSVITIFAFLITFFIAPKFETKYKNFLMDSKNEIASFVLKDGEFTEVAENLTIYTKSQTSNVLKNIFIYDGRDKNKKRVIVAEKGIMSSENKNIYISLLNGSVQEENNNKITIGKFEKYTADLGVIAKHYTRERNIKEFSIIAIVKQVINGEHTRPLKELYRRIVEPLYNIIFAFFALITIFKTPYQRTRSSLNIFIASGVALLFKVLTIYSYRFISGKIYNFFIFLFVIIMMIVLLKNILKDRVKGKR